MSELNSKYNYCGCTGLYVYRNEIRDNKYVHDCSKCNKEVLLDEISTPVLQKIDLKDLQ